LFGDFGFIVSGFIPDVFLLFSPWEQGVVAELHIRVAKPLGLGKSIKPVWVALGPQTQGYCFVASDVSVGRKTPRQRRGTLQTGIVGADLCVCPDNLEKQKGSGEHIGSPLLSMSNQNCRANL